MMRSPLPVLFVFNIFFNINSSVAKTRIAPSAQLMICAKICILFLRFVAQTLSNLRADHGDLFFKSPCVKRIFDAND